MARFNTFTFRVTQEERRLIEKLATRLQRSQSDAIRLVIREAIKEVSAADPSQQPLTATSGNGGGNGQ